MKRVLVIAAVLACFGAAALVSEDRTADRPVLAAEFDLPAGFQPEGIAIGSRPVAYLGSRADGSIYRADLVTGRGDMLSPGRGTPALGLQLDHRGRLFVAGGTGGDARVVDTGTGAVLASYPLGTPPDTFVNDMVLTPTGAWLTDSRTPVLYHLPISDGDALPPPGAVVRRPLTGDIRYEPGAINANGIVRTPDGAGLIIMQSVTGRLFRVDPATGATRQIDLGAETLPNGDGLLLRGNTLLVVQNRSNAIAVVTLDHAGTTGSVIRRVTDPRFDVPTTVAAYGDRLYLPNARYTTPPTPATPYSAVAVDRP
ncbi:superoxide dismutase [Nocardia sp. CDC186]|uniref:Superoxide dismutase n=1 Tax=Nocardia implantans TaxID=3108168 RepID=A0ABU6AT68_9NOCA|nr:MULTISPECIES: superoxide dismutase [unclassified Nocardia]MBF6191016.1 superoxide dismutase [Nocardia beijingensis]MEA3529011.1 superoxide dismutase [Nocardia sp. CDC192]MEB3510676.1 superoxide dismutase [Nocardia sp. CDC186]